MPIVLRTLEARGSVSGKTINVCARGAKVSSEDIDELRVGSRLDVRIAWTGGPEKPSRWLCGRGRVVWVSPEMPELEGDPSRWAGEPGSLGLCFDGPLAVES